MTQFDDSDSDADTGFATPHSKITRKLQGDWENYIDVDLSKWSTYQRSLCLLLQSHRLLSKLLSSPVPSHLQWYKNCEVTQMNCIGYGIQNYVSNLLNPIFTQNMPFFGIPAGTVVSSTANDSIESSSVITEAELNPISTSVKRNEIVQNYKLQLMNKVSVCGWIDLIIFDRGIKLQSKNKEQSQASSECDSTIWGFPIPKCETRCYQLENWQK